jgi:hypothetical protein
MLYIVLWWDRIRLPGLPIWDLYRRAHLCVYIIYLLVVILYGSGIQNRRLHHITVTNNIYKQTTT